MRPTAVPPLAIALLLAACTGAAPSDGTASTTVAVGSSTTAEVTAEERTDEADGTDGGSAGGVQADGDDTVDEATDQQRAAAEQQAAERPTVEALWWTAPTVDGGTFAAGDVAGEKVVLWMWAPWCSVCNAEAPDVARALADLPDDVTVIGVAGRDDVGPMQEFVAEHGLGDVVHVVDEDGSLWASYGISYQPAWVFITPEGEASVAAGALGYDGLFAAIDQVFGA